MKKLYGNDSVKLGKLYKEIGIIQIFNGNNGKAKTYLKMAYKIFEAKGIGKLMSEVGEKIKSLGSPDEDNDYTSSAKNTVPPLILRDKKKPKKRVIK